MSNKIPRIAIGLFRGIEGCGCTKNAIEFVKANPTAKIFATEDKKWPRRKSQEIDCTSFKLADDTKKDALIKIINENFDIILLYSIPSKSHPEKCISNFLEFVKAIKIPSALIQVDHAIQSLHRNANLVEVSNNVDVLLTHSLTSEFVKYCNKFDVKTPIKTMGVGFDFDKHRKKYWLPIEEQDNKMVRWIGRTAAWKGYSLMIDYHNRVLRKLGFITILEGLEASINYTDVLYDNKKDLTTLRDVNNFFRPLTEEEKIRKKTMKYGNEKTNTGPYLYPQYNNDECMNRLKRSAFGSDLYNLKPHKYGNNIEYCHAEIIACGCIPVFHKHFGDNIIHKKQGKPLTECENNGTIFLDDSNYKEVTKLIYKLSNDNVMRDKWREDSFKFWKEHASGNVIFDEMVSNTLSAFKLNKKR